MNNKNSTIKEIAETLKGARRIALFPHVNIDGDAFGSCIALAHALAVLGKTCRIVLSEEIPENLQFLDEEMLFSRIISDLDNREELIENDIGIMMDLGELKRIPGREEFFNSSKLTICLDHHGTTEPFCHMNYIDSDAAATGQIVYKLILELFNESKDEACDLVSDSIPGEEKRKIAEALFAAITTDTGDFQYSNTQKESHEIVANLYDWGLNANKVSVEIYENNRIERLRLTSEVLATIELICHGKVALAYCSQEMLKRTGAKMEETEWIASDLRGIRGVEVAIFLKEENENTIKASLRSKKYFDVSSFAQEFGGGGHIRAAGYTVKTSLHDALDDIRKKIEKEL